MLSHLTQVQVEDDDGNMVGLDDAAVAGFGGLIGGAGAEIKLVGNAVVVFGQHRDQWDMVKDDPSVIPAPSKSSCGTCRPRSSRDAWR